MKINLTASEFSAFVKVCGEDFIVNPGVYDTSVDTELMAEAVKIDSSETFLEIGCGTGAISLLLAKKCLGGLATDINPAAVLNAKENARQRCLENISFCIGDCFADIKEKFNVLICNPPYNNYPARDVVDQMFWDTNNDLKKKFFSGAAEHLLPGGRIYFGWANFKDLDLELPLKLAAENNFSVTNIFERPSRSGKNIFYVFEFVLKNNP